MLQSSVFKLFQEQDFIFDQEVDLNNCDREPIHVPGSIQPHGVLLVLDESLTVCQLSTNTSQYFGLEPAELLQKKLQDVIGASASEEVSKRISSLTYQQNFSISVDGFADPCEVVLHRNEQCFVLEFESCSAKVGDVTLSQYAEMLQRLQAAGSVRQLCQCAAETVKEISGFSRVMVYQFHEDGHGEVVAEAAEAQLEPFLGLHYPATDIPKQARVLYLHNPIRLIPTIHYEPVPLQPTVNPRTGKVLNLSLSTLRSVSPIHLQYLQNMGVEASMSISIVSEGRLWGLFACHHQKPYQIPYSYREACYLLARSFSSILQDRIRRQEESYLTRIREVQARLFERMSQAEHYTSSLYRQSPTIKELIDCGGCAICFGDEFHTIGNTPTEEQVRELVAWLQKESSADVYSTRALPAAYPGAVAYKSVASGLLAITVSRVQQEYILWFRPEVVETVVWAGKSSKDVQVGQDGELLLTPRKSFEAWAEQVEGTAVAWLPVEEQAVREMRGLLVDVVMRVAGELKLRAGILARLNKELERSNSELDSFAYIASHDLKEPLRGIHNYSQFLLEDYQDKLDAAGTEKLKTLMRLSVRMEQLINSLLQYSRVGRADIYKTAVNFNKVVEEAKGLLRERLEAMQVTITIVKELPVVECDEIQVLALFQNLLVNAIKYNNSEEVHIEIGWEPEFDPSLKKERKVFWVKDNGIGIEERHFEVVFNIFRRLHARQSYGGGTGIGLTIVKKIVERHGGRIWLDSQPGIGTTFYFTLED